MTHGRPRRSACCARRGRRADEFIFCPGVTRNPLKLLDSRKGMEGNGRKWKGFFGSIAFPEARRTRPSPLLKEIETSMALERRLARKWRRKPLESLEASPGCGPSWRHLSSTVIPANAGIRPPPLLSNLLRASPLDARFRGHDKIERPQSGGRPQMAPQALGIAQNAPGNGARRPAPLCSAPVARLYQRRSENRFGEPD